MIGKRMFKIDYTATCEATVFIAANTEEEAIALFKEEPLTCIEKGGTDPDELPNIRRIDNIMELKEHL